MGGSLDLLFKTAGAPMDNDWISVIDVARHFGKRKSTVFKVLKRLGIEPKKLRNSSSGNQLVAYITQDELRAVRGELVLMAETGQSEGSTEIGDLGSVEDGVFYIVQLEPDLDPGRFKAGFAAGMSDRLRQLRCSAPFASVVRTWPCRRLWERTAIECVSAGCERLHTEVYRTIALEEVVDRGERFFGVMPAVQPSAGVVTAATCDPSAPLAVRS